MADTKQPKQTKPFHDPGLDRFEKSDASFTQIFVWMLVILVLVLLTASAVWGYYHHFTQRYVAEAKARRSPLLADGQVVQQIPGPVLQLNPQVTLQAFNEQQNQALLEYSWVSKEAGVVRLPIEQAKKKVLEGGLLKSRPQDPETTATVPDDGASQPQDSSSGRTFWNLQR